MRRRTNVHFSTVLAAGCIVAIAAACGSSSSSEFPGGTQKDGGASGGGGNEAGSTLGGGGLGGLGGVGDGGVAFSSLAFDPPAATVQVSGTTPITTSFTLKAHLANGSDLAVTPDTISFDRPDIGSIVNGDPVVATAPSTLGVFGGTGTIHAIYGGVGATATLTVQIRDVDYGAGLTATSPSIVAFGGEGGAGVDGGAATVNSDGTVNLPADPAINPGDTNNATSISPLLYPYDQTVFPLGITSPQIMFNAPSASDIYWVHYVEQNYTFDGYYPLASATGQLRIPQAIWDRITASNAAATAKDPLAFTLSRFDSSANKAYKSSTQTWTIAPESLQGAIYYWTTPNLNDSNAPGAAVTRIPPGTGAVPVPITAPDKSTCTGCHAVSADGSTLVAGVSGENDTDGVGDNRTWASFDLPSGNLRKLSTLFSGNMALTPDGKYIVAGDGDNSHNPSESLVLADTATATIVTTSNLDKTMLDANYTGLKDPAFAPSGKAMVAVETGGDWQYWDYSLPVISTLVTLTFDPTALSFSTVPTKLADSTNSKFTAGQVTIAYPSFSPDSSFLAYQVGDHASGCSGNGSNSCSTTTLENASIFAQSASGGDPVRLTALSDPPVFPKDKDNSLEPTFNPTPRGGYFWIVFTSGRHWGNQDKIQVDGFADNNSKRLWVSAVDPAVGTVDFSHPAFYLEGQDNTTTNMRGFWTQAACIATPTAGAPASGSDAGATGADGGAAGACVNGFDCCSGFCEQGVCIGVSAVACSDVNGTCTTVGDCCNQDAVSCTNGKCTVNGVR